MGRRFISKVTLVLLLSIIVLFILGNSTEIMIKTFKPDFIAGMLSLVIGVFAFIQEKILSRKTRITHLIFQLFTVLVGAIILLPEAYEYIKLQNEFADSIIIGVYLLLMFSFAYATRDEHVEKNEISQANTMMSNSDNKSIHRKRKKNN